VTPGFIRTAACAVIAVLSLTFAPGAFADVMAVQGDPVANVEALKSVKFVMKDGNVFKQ